MYWSIESHEELIKVVYTFLSSSSLTILYGIWQVFFGFEYINKQSLTPFGSLFRAAGLHGFYLTFAAFAMIIFLLSVALFVEVKKKEKWLFLALAFLSFGAVVGTFARSIWLSFVAVIPSFGFLKSRKTGILVSVSFLILVLILVVIFPAIRERVTSFVDPSQSETRLNLWKTSLSVFADNPILGVGEDNFDYHFEHYKVEGFYDTIVHPHNDYLNILVQSGLPGLIAWLTIWGIALSSGMNAFRSLRDARVKAIAVGATLSLIGFLVGSFFQNYYGTFYNCLEWWFIVGMIMTTEKFKDS
jgi:O-antigen ligase